MAEALGIAAAVAQFASMGFKFVRFAYGVFGDSGDMIKEYNEILLVTTDIENIMARLLSDRGRQALREEGDKEMLKLALESKKAAAELLVLLKGLKRKKDKWEKQEKAKSATKKVKIDGSDEGLSVRSEKIRTLFRMTFNLDDIRQLETRLQRLVGGVSLQTTQRMKSQQNQMMDSIRRMEHEIRDLAEILKSVREDIITAHGTIGDVSNGLGSSSGYKADFIELSKVVNEVVFGITVVDALQDDELSGRYRQVKRTEEGTVRWALDISQNPLNEWLRSRNGLFWIHGKPGSGKSTLMKHLVQCDSTAQLLKQWAGDGKLVIANHFFWAAGSEMQKSLLGLYRSLFAQVFEQHPSLINHVVQQQPNGMQRVDLKCLEHWFERLMAFAACNPSYKFCILIDGLDEYGTGIDGHVLEIADVAKTLSNSETPNMKVLVSSRPFTTFRSAFKNCPNLLMEEFTMPDMEIYAWRQLEPVIPPSSDQNGQLGRWRELASDIAQRAMGVWLWVYLVVREIRKVVANNEGFKKVKEILERFPSDLEDYFRQTIARTEPQFQRDGSRLLLLATEMERPITLLGFCLFLHDPEEAENCIQRLHRPFTDLPADEELCRLSTLQDRLNNRTMGLLEFQLPDGLNQREFSTTELDSVGKFHEICIGFLHRTVRDFLTTYHKEKLLDTAGKDFNLGLYTLCLTIVDNFEGMRSASFYRGFTTVGSISAEIPLEEFTNHAVEADGLLCSYLDQEYIKQANDDGFATPRWEPALISALKSVLGPDAYTLYSSSSSGSMRNIFKLYIDLIESATSTVFGRDLRPSFQDNLFLNHHYRLTHFEVRFSSFFSRQNRPGQSARIQSLFWATNKKLLLYLALTSSTNNKTSSDSYNYSMLLCWFLALNMAVDIELGPYLKAGRNQQNLAMVYLFLDIAGADPNCKFDIGDFNIWVDGRVADGSTSNGEVDRPAITPWSFLLLLFAKHDLIKAWTVNDGLRQGTCTAPTNIYDLLRIFLTFGADPTTKFKLPMGRTVSSHPDPRLSKSLFGHEPEWFKWVKSKLVSKARATETFNAHGILGERIGATRARMLVDSVGKSCEEQALPLASTERGVRAKVSKYRK